jgi:RimJ/RimL family protein N-acetyltransferase
MSADAPRTTTFPDDVPTLTDGTVTLRAHRESDAGPLYEQATDPLMVGWTTVPTPYTFEHARRFVTELIPSGWRDGSRWGFAVEAPDDEGAPRFVGTVELRDEGEGRAEVAYGAHPWARGRGYVDRALRLLLEWGFTTQDLRTVIWWANRGNWASRKVAWRLGFSMDGTVRRWLPQRGETRDGWVGTLLAGEKLEPRHPWFTVPVIHGDGMVLREHRDADAPAIQEACSDPRTQHWLEGMPNPYTLRDAQEFLETRREQHATGTGLTWVVADPGTDAPLGQVSLFNLKPGHEAEIGYWTHPAARGRGLMTRACGLVVRHAFVPEEDGGMGLQRLCIYVGEGNAASCRVAEANGFTLTGRDRHGTRLRDGTLVDQLVYDLLVSEYRR